MNTNRIFHQGYALSENFFRALLRPFRKGLGKISGQTILTLPNLISFTRGFIIGPLILIYANSGWRLQSTLLGLGIFSDHLDGSLARFLGCSSQLGIILDPIADRLLFLFFAAAHWSDFQLIPLVIMVTAEILVLTGPTIYLKAKGMKLSDADWSPNIYGKWRFLSECLAMAAALAGCRWTSSVILGVALWFLYKAGKEKKATYRVVK